MLVLTPPEPEPVPAQAELPRVSDTDLERSGQLLLVSA